MSYWLAFDFVMLIGLSWVRCYMVMDIKSGTCLMNPLVYAYMYNYAHKKRVVNRQEANFM